MDAAAPELVITPETMIPDMLQVYPQTRGVLDRYGLKGCGGPLGPHESIGLFARAHEVDLPTLLLEIAQALKSPPAAGASGAALPHSEPAKLDIADTIYRRFFLAGIAVMLTLGASWGAYLLFAIGHGGSFSSINMHEINAHAQAQVFGWMGFFIMGFGCQAFPRFWHTSLQKPALAVLSFYLMLSGIILSCLGITGVHALPYAREAAVGGSLLELSALIIFAAQMLITFKHSRRSLEPYIGYVFTALAWFIASAAFNCWQVASGLAAASPSEMERFVSIYQWPLRDMQFHGLGMTIIMGVSMRTLPHLFGLPPVPPRRAWTALALLTAAVISEIALYIAFKLTQETLYASMLIVPWTMLLGASVMLVLPFKLWRPFPEPDRSAKFIACAYLWLMISLGMLILAPLYAAASHLQFSHAYFGAIRHAITVGFISQMIMAYAAKVVPTLNGVDKKQLSQLMGPFLLINAGCLLRVTLQTLTDWNQAAFPFIGISGTLEVAALAWWGLHLTQIILRGRREMQNILQAADTPVPPTTQRPEKISAEHMVADVLDWYPQTEPVFVRFGFAAVTNPVMRKTVARQVPLKRACMMHGTSEAEFIQALNEAISAEPGQAVDSFCANSSPACDCPHAPLN